jgi:ATP-dependent Clp protease ATP-binding subunit ClpC
MPSILEKFSDNFKQSLENASDLAQELKHPNTEPQHIFYGLIKQKGSVGAEVFYDLGIKSVDIKRIIDNPQQKIKSIPTKIAPKFSSSSKELIQQAVQIAYNQKHQYIGTEHLLAALLKTSDPAIIQIIKTTKTSNHKLSEQVRGLLKSASKLPDITETFKIIQEEQEREGSDKNQTTATNPLDIFGINLTDPKNQKNIDPVIGRQKEIDRIIQILSRRTKNNPLLLGDPGVGKTAIIEGLAKKILSGDVPRVLQDKKIYSLDLTSTIAGTMYRGEFENRIKQIIDEVKNHDDIILFIDEIHNIVGAGSTSGSMDAANILKPALARGEIHCIGATTYNDYRKTIENDTALERRFQSVKIVEPTIDDTKQILTGLKPFFEGFHEIQITERAINAAVDLSQRYLPEKFLPDKAIDLIDEAASAVKVGRKKSKGESEFELIAQKITDAENQKEVSIIKEDFELAIKSREKITHLQNKLTELKEKYKNSQKKYHGTINERHIAQTITKITGIPTEDLIGSEKKKVLNLEKNLNQKIIGQETATENIANLVKRAKTGLTPTNRPLASFIFVGPSGTGKTHTAQILAELVFNDPQAIVRIDMSEYSEKFNISKLIGAPAGYVGYKESGQLTEQIKNRPYSVVLFDEIEKANPEIFDLLLQVLDNGFLTDASGRKINFQNTIIVMTSNLGSNQIMAKDSKVLGFNSEPQKSNQADWRDSFIDAIKSHLKIEFLNRIDKIVYFNPLSIEAIEKIVKTELEDTAQRVCNAQNIKIQYTKSLIKTISKDCYNPHQGARLIKKIIQNKLETKLADQILSEKVKPYDTVQIKVKNGIICAERLAK